MWSPHIRDPCGRVFLLCSPFPHHHTSSRMAVGSGTTTSSEEERPSSTPPHELEPNQWKLLLKQTRKLNYIGFNSFGSTYPISQFRNMNKTKPIYMRKLKWTYSFSLMLICTWAGPTPTRTRFPQGRRDVGRNWIPSVRDGLHRCSGAARRANP